MLLLPERLKEYSDDLAAHLAEGRFKEAKEVLPHLSHTRLAAVLTNAPKIVVLPFLEYVGGSHAALTIAEFPEEFAAHLLEDTQSKTALEWLAHIPPEKSVDILSHMTQEKRESLVSALPKQAAENILALSIYEENTVGAEMSLDYIAVSEDQSVSEVMEAVKSLPSPLTRTGYLYVVDDKKRLRGVLSLRELLAGKSKQKVSAIMNEDIFAARVFDNPVEIAERIRSRHLKMMPVVTKTNVLVGVMTAEAALELLSYELAEDLAGIGAGVSDESFFTPARKSVRMRLPWMVINVFLCLAAVSIIAGFEDTIAQAAILAAFLPLITGMGGNVGIQALSVSIRSIALGEARMHDYWRALRKEFAVGLAQGVALGYLFGIIAYMMEGNIILGLVAGTALGINVLVAGVFGGTLPFLIKRFGKDPALLTGPILMTITDITGVSIYLGLCTIFLFGIV